MAYYFHAVFFLTVRLTTRSTVFPYTTLFRSIESLAVRGTATIVGVLPPDARIEFPWMAIRPEGRVQTDRKSTRLNSSHGYISYAVFCLKKKNSVQPLNCSPVPSVFAQEKLPF